MKESDYFGRPPERREINSLVNPVIIFCETSIIEGGDAVVQCIDPGIEIGGGKAESQGSGL